MEETKVDLGRGSKANLGRRIQRDQRCIPLNYPALFMRELGGARANARGSYIGLQMKLHKFLLFGVASPYIRLILYNSCHLQWSCKSHNL
jgi:hypothetical protein